MIPYTLQKAFTPILLIFLSGFLFAQMPYTTVFQKGEGNYACFRIPAIIKSPDGSLLAFCEARRHSCSDHGDVRIVMKTSKDRGKTWSEMQTVADNGVFQAGNPAPVYDMMDKKYKQGRLFLFYNTGTVSEQEVREGKAIREVWYKTSTDHGINWSKPVNITHLVSKPNKPELNKKYKFKEDWRSYAITPGHALQLTKGKYQGRLFIPANHSQGPPQPNFYDYRAHGFYTDDHGKSWHLSADVDYKSSNESTAAQLADGSILMNIRNQSGDTKHRILAFSLSGGASWDTVYVEKSLPDPVCQGSMINHTLADGREVILFSNLDHQSKRENLTLKMSADDGRSWQKVVKICEGGAAYSDLVIQNDDKIGVLYERDDYSKIVFSTVDLDFRYEKADIPLHVMTFNIRYNTSRDSINAWPNRKEKVASQILFHEAHIVGIQEALHDQILDLQSKLQSYQYIGVGRDDGHYKGEYSAIFYDTTRIRVIASQTFWLSETPTLAGSKSWDAAITRIVTWAKMEDVHTGKSFYTFNTHFDHIGQTARRESAKLLRKTISQLAGDTPAIITGDFNAFPSDEPIRMLTSMDQSSPLIDSKTLSQSGHYGPAGTFNGFQPKEISDQPIDYIFLNRPMTILQHATLSQTWSGLFSSDHFPVFVKLVLP